MWSSDSESEDGKFTCESEKLEASKSIRALLTKNSFQG